MNAILIISHGSRSPRTIDEVKSLVEQIRNKTEIKIIEFAFLELAEPSIPEGIDLCVGKGASNIKILLNFLNAGMHVDKDIPAIVKEAQQKHPDVNMSISEPVGQHPRISELFLDMLK